MTVHYARNLRCTGPSNTAADMGFQSDADWHATAISDTGTSYIPAGRQYVIQCEWCDDVFIANTKAEALHMFRDHETLVQQFTEPVTPRLAGTAVVGLATLSYAATALEGSADNGDRYAAKQIRDAIAAAHRDGEKR